MESFLEFVSFDPVQGAIFYVMDEHRSDRPRFERSEVDCVQCHVSPSTRNVPGVMIRSVVTKPSGYPAAGTASFVTGHESPMSQRWGGWYVTAKSTAPHMGNVTTADSKQGPASSVEALEGRLDTTRYLSGSSDIVALMVLAHQTQMHNLITLTNYQTRLAQAEDEKRNTAAGLAPGTISDQARKRFEAPAEQLIRYLLFTNEAPLESAIAGTSSFTEEFTARGPRDAKGRSLRDFDLRTRLFRYRCSYLIYSEDFDALPVPAKEYVYRRLLEVLSGRDQSPDFASLSTEDRRTILEILVATKPGIADQWRQFRPKPVREIATAPMSAR